MHSPVEITGANRPRYYIALLLITIILGTRSWTRGLKHFLNYYIPTVIMTNLTAALFDIRCHSAFNLAMVLRSIFI